ncbi:MAG: hypothetical protein JNL09_00790, partial [Anaerolineales bacterium]|nr:hypothetical protein [Anaerolineales bacterium]
HAEEVADENERKGLVPSSGLGLRDGQGFIIIEEKQVGLKRVTFRIIWEGGPGAEATPCTVGNTREFCQTTYIHRDANYRQGP